MIMSKLCGSITWLIVFAVLHTWDIILTLIGLQRMYNKVNVAIGTLAGTFQRLSW
jgi:hypothetical protein